MNKALFIILFFFYLNIFGQTDYITQIRANYKKVNEQIDICEKSFDQDCSLYCNEIIVNSKDKMWRAVGNYKQKIKFWYTDEPKFAYAEEKKESSVLQKVIIQRESAAVKEYEEWLFDDGTLQFFYIKQLDGEFNQNIEAKYYFKEGKLIKTIISDESKGYYTNSVASILDKSAKLIQLFLKTFEI